MSALNAIIRPDRILVSTDTASYRPGTGEITAFASKLEFAPVYNTTFVFRAMNGMTVPFFMMLVGVKQNESNNNSIDSILEWLPEMLDSAVAMFMALDPTYTHEQAKTELLAAGYSNNEKRCIAYHVSYDAEEKHSGMVRMVDGFVTAPHVPDFVPKRQNEPVAFFVEYATAQREYFKTLPVKGSVGGDLLMATISRHGYEAKRIHSWGDKIVTPENYAEYFAGTPQARMWKLFAPAHVVQ